MVNYLKCEHCGAEDETVERVADPYILDLYKEEELVNLCEECFTRRADER